MTKVLEISSPQNKIFKIFKSLLKTDGISENQQALIFGEKIVTTLSRPETRAQVRGIICKEKHRNVEGPSRYVLSPELFSEIDIFGTDFPIGIVNVPTTDEVGENYRPIGCELVLPLQDPSNLGALVRSAAAFGIKRILLDEESSNPFHPRSSRAASGTLFQVDFLKVGDRRSLCQPVLMLDKDGEDLKTFSFPENFFLLVGQEGRGAPSGYKIDQRISIPIKNDVESLNATVAASIALYHWSRRT